MLPRLHLVTNDAILADPDFADRARAIVGELEGVVALHLRGRSTSGRVLYELASQLSLLPRARILLNDRVDVALASHAAGVQLPVTGLPVSHARALLGEDRWIGCSVHTAAEAQGAEAAGADFLLAGTIYPSATHPDARPQGLDFLSRLGTVVSVPLVAIGGVSAERAAECLHAGAYGVAVVRAVWHSEAPLRAARELLHQLELVST